MMIPDSSAEKDGAVRRPLEGVENVSIDPIDNLRRFLEHIDIGSVEGVDYRLTHFLVTTDGVCDQEVHIVLVQQ